jgi:hypothetical protein
MDPLGDFSGDACHGVEPYLIPREWAHARSRLIYTEAVVRKGGSMIPVIQ